MQIYFHTPLLNPSNYLSTATHHITLLPMGNCQAAEAAMTVVILHPGGNKVERIYSSMTANEFMNSHPGYYVAVLMKTENGSSTKRMKLLKPDESLMVGQIYRLISFEDVLKQFAVKKCVKLERLLKERGALKDMDQFIKVHSASNFQLDSESRIDDSIRKKEELEKNGRSSRRDVRRSKGGARQWKPALHSISEQQLGT